MKRVAVHLAFNYSEAWAAGNSSVAASVFAGAGEKTSFFPPSQLRSSTNVPSPTPTPTGAYLPNRGALQMPPCLLRSRKAQRSQLRGHLGQRSLGPSRRQVSKSSGAPIPPPGVTGLQSQPRCRRRELFQRDCLWHPASRGRR